MSTLALSADTVTVRLTTAEKLAGVHGDLAFPLTAVTRVEVVPDALAAAHGLRAPGFSLPGVRKIGTWRSRDGAEFVVASAGEPGVRLYLQGQSVVSVVVGDPEAASLAREIERAVERAGEPR